MRLSLFTLISVFIFTLGCQQPKSQPDAAQHNPYAVLSPIKFAGDATIAAGEGINSLADQNFWLQRPERVKGTPTKEMLADLDKTSVEFDFSYELNTATGFGAGSHQFQQPLRSFLMSIENMARARFDWRLNPRLPDVAMAFPGGVIVVNPNIMGRLTKRGMVFMHLHEAGHHMRGHTTNAQYQDSRRRPWIIPQKELEADAYAARTMLRAGFPKQVIILAAIESVGQSPGGPQHPPGPARVANVRRALGAR